MLLKKHKPFPQPQAQQKPGHTDRLPWFSHVACGSGLGNLEERKHGTQETERSLGQPTYLTAILAFHSLVNLGNFFIWILQKLMKTKKYQSTKGTHGATQRQKHGEKWGEKVC